MDSLEIKLIKMLKAEHIDAYTQLVDHYGEKLLRISYIIIGDYQLAEDALQEAYINIYRNINRFNEKSSLLTWITRITINCAKQTLKKKKGKSSTAFYDNTTQVQESPSVDCEIIKKEETKSIRIILTNLPIKYRETLYLYYYEEMKVKEIAEVLDISQSGVKSRLQRGRNLLEKLLREELD